MTWVSELGARIRENGRVKERKNGTENKEREKSK